MNSDTNSDITIYQTISQLNNSDIETPDEFADSEPSPSTHTRTNSSTFSKPPFRPIQPQSQCTSPYTPSQVTPTCSPFNNERSTNNSPDNIQISEELDNFITLQKRLLPPHTHYSPIIINNNIIKSTNTYTNFRLYPVINRNIH